MRWTVRPFYRVHSRRQYVRHRRRRAGKSSTAEKKLRAPWVGASWRRTDDRFFDRSSITRRSNITGSFTTEDDGRRKMATVRGGNTGILLVVDVQVGVMGESWDSDRIIKNVASAVARARAEGVPVVWVQHSDEELLYGSPQWQWVPELAPAKGEPLIHKKFNSSFEQTQLEDELAKLGATHVVLAGASTNWCIRATA